MLLSSTSVLRNTFCSQVKTHAFAHVKNVFFLLRFVFFTSTQPDPILDTHVNCWTLDLLSRHLFWARLSRIRRIKCSMAEKALVIFSTDANSCKELKDVEPSDGCPESSASMYNVATVAYLRVIMAELSLLCLLNCWWTGNVLLSQLWLYPPFHSFLIRKEHSLQPREHMDPLENQWGPALIDHLQWPAISLSSTRVPSNIQLKMYVSQLSSNPVKHNFPSYSLIF